MEYSVPGQGDFLMVCRAGDCRVHRHGSGIDLSVFHNGQDDV